MEKLIAACGLDCAACPGYIAWKTDDQQLRVKTAAEWKEVHGFDGTPDMVNCIGCMSAGEGPRIGYCSACELRTCAVERKMTTCAACPDYSCEPLAGFHEHVPQAKTALEGLRA